MKNFQWLWFYGFTMRELYWLRIEGLDFGLALKSGGYDDKERSYVVAGTPAVFGWSVALMRAP